MVTGSPPPTPHPQILSAYDFEEDIYDIWTFGEPHLSHSKSQLKDSDLSTTNRTLIGLDFTFLSPLC